MVRFSALVVGSTLTLGAVLLGARTPMAIGSGSVVVEITGGPRVTVPWSAGMNAQDALERAYDSSGGSFTYALQYYGPRVGYFVVMINDTYQTFVPSLPSSRPLFLGVPRQR
jgi:hypothetical protein